tara:strand:+ start:471 stop:674 length:204 start_codon:yes stop_codon:yes gene_type:complete
MTVRGKKPNVEAVSTASPRKQSGKEQQQEFTKLMEQMVKSMERVFGKGIQLEVEPKIPIKINKKKLN